MTETTCEVPEGEIAMRTRAMPADTNPAGDIFGGWILAQMDLAGAGFAIRRAQGRVATVAVDAVELHKPVFVGDELTCYAQIKRIGRTSMTVGVEAWVRRASMGQPIKVTSACFTFVAIDANRNPRPVPPESEGA